MGSRERFLKQKRWMKSLIHLGKKIDHVINLTVDRSFLLSTTNWPTNL